MNWDGERVIINAQDQEHDTDSFKKMSGSMHITNKALRLDIVIKHKKEKSAFFIEVSVPNDFGRHATEIRKMTKYQVLKNEVKRTSKMKKAEIIPVIVGARGMIRKTLTEYLNITLGISFQTSCKWRLSEVQ